MERYSYEQDESYIKRLVEYIRELEEELKKYKHYYDYEKEELADSCYDFSRENDKLKEENRKLKEELEKDNREVQVDVDKELLKANDYLINENKNLKAENDRLKQNAMEDMRVQTKLEEEIDNCLKEVKLCYNDIHSLE